MTTDQGHTAPRSWHRYFQFRLRTLMLFTAAVAVGMWFYTRLEVLESQPMPGYKARWQAYRTPEGSPLRHGWWELRDADGRLSATGEYRHDKPHGEWTWRHPSGRIRQQGEYHDGQRHGVWKTFYDDGQPRDERTYAEGQLNGPARSWRPDGTLASEGQYSEGRQSGAWTVTDEQGRTASGDMADDRRTGRWHFHGAEGAELPSVEYAEGVAVADDAGLIETWRKKLLADSPNAGSFTRRTEAAWALGRLGERGQTALDESTRSEFAEIRGAAFAELAGHPAWCRANIDRLIAGLNGTTQPVQLAIMRALIPLEDAAKPAIPKLLSLAEAATDPSDAVYRRCALATVISIDPSRADVTERLLDGFPVYEFYGPSFMRPPMDWPVKAEHLGQRAEVALRNAIKSSRGEVRHNAMAILYYAWPPRVLSDVTVEAIITDLDDTDIENLRLACWLLARMGDPAKSAEPKLEQLARDPNKQVAEAAASALQSIRGQLPQPGIGGGGFF